MGLEAFLSAYLRADAMPTDCSVDRSAGDDDRTSALLILASSVDPNLASTCDRVVLSSNDPHPHDQAQPGRHGGPGLVSSHAVGP